MAAAPGPPARAGSDEALAALEPVALAVDRVPMARIEEWLDAIHHHVDQALELRAVRELGLGRERLEPSRDVEGSHLLVGDRVPEAVHDVGRLREDALARVDEVDVVGAHGHDGAAEVERDLAQADVASREADGPTALREDQEIEASVEGLAVELDEEPHHGAE